MQGDGAEADALRNKKFKLIPRIVKGSWIVKQSVGTTPVLLGQKLATRYFRGPNYFEVKLYECCGDGLEAMLDAILEAVLGGVS
jgi:hypothetical protein